MKVTTMSEGLSHINRNGEVFAPTLKKRRLSEQHNYWLYFIVSKHESWGERGFYVFVTKQSYPNESLADHLASTLAISEVKARLEAATEEGMPLLVPTLHEGWGVL